MVNDKGLTPEQVKEILEKFLSDPVRLDLKEKIDWEKKRAEIRGYGIGGLVYSKAGAIKAAVYEYQLEQYEKIIYPQIGVQKSESLVEFPTVSGGSKFVGGLKIKGSPFLESGSMVRMGDTIIVCDNEIYSWCFFNEGVNDFSIMVACRIAYDRVCQRIEDKHSTISINNKL